MVAVGCLLPVIFFVIGLPIGGAIGGQHGSILGAVVGAAFGVIVMIALFWGWERITHGSPE